MERFGIRAIKSLSGFQINNLVVGGGDSLNLVDFSYNGVNSFIRVMRNLNSRERVNSRDFVSSDLASKKNRGLDNGIMIDSGSHVGFSSSFFGSNET